jgi:hypothetical protein
MGKGLFWTFFLVGCATSALCEKPALPPPVPDQHCRDSLRWIFRCYLRFEELAKQPGSRTDFDGSAVRRCRHRHRPGRDPDLLGFDAGYQTAEQLTRRELGSTVTL